MRIDELTPEQERMMIEARDQWVRIGKSCEWTPDVRPIIYRWYELVLGRPKPDLIIWLDSPLSAGYGAALVATWYHTKDQVGQQVGQQVWQQVEKQVRQQVSQQVRQQVWDQVGQQVDDQVRQQVRQQVWDQVGQQVSQQVRQGIDLQYQRPWWTGRGEVAWIAHYECMFRFGLTASESLQRKFYACAEMAKISHWVWPLEGCCILSKPPTVWHQNALGQLHCDSGPAMAYNDGFALWQLNGVPVPQWLAEARAETIDPRKFSEIENVEVRREFVRKVGVERIVQATGAKQLDKRGDYELIEVDLNGRTGKWPYLKMLNPSIGVWHLECVARECKTVAQAIAWRNQSSTEPEVLT